MQVLTVEIVSEATVSGFTTWDYPLVPKAPRGIPLPFSVVERVQKIGNGGFPSILVEESPQHFPYHRTIRKALERTGELRSVPCTLYLHCFVKRKPDFRIFLLQKRHDIDNPSVFIPVPMNQNDAPIDRLLP